MEDLKVPEINRSISCESGNTVYSDAMSSFEDDDDDLDGYYGDQVDIAIETDDAEITMHHQLYTDMENLLVLYGEKALQYRLFESIDEIDVELQIPLGFLEAETAEAWKVNRSEPLIVRLHLSLSRYLESTTVPKVEVFQASKKENFGFGTQFRKIIDNFFSSHWHGVNAQYQDYLTEQAKAKKSQSYPGGLKHGSAKGGENGTDTNDENIATLMGMGFGADMARNALIITHGSVQEASNLLLSNPETCSEMTIHDQAVLSQTGSDSKNVTIETNTSAEAGTSNVQTYPAKSSSDNTIATTKQTTPDTEILTPSQPPKPKRQHSHPPLLRKLKSILPSLNRTISMTPSATDSNIAINTPLEDLNLMPQSTLIGKNAKNVPSISEGFLVQVFRYVRQRIPTINEYCVVCDDQHVFQNGAMLKPAVCSRELCVFAFQTLGVMADAAEDIATGAEVVDLLLNMTIFASKSTRKQTIFDPFPTVVDPKNPCNLLFNPKHKNFEAIEKVLQVMPSMNEMSQMTASLKKSLTQIEPATYPLLQWIITSNRSHIVKLPLERQLDFMSTPHQFLMLSSPPAKEAVFGEAKKKHGSTFAFHGSSIENWHSIIRQGLVNASGTKLQVNGAAYGKGIYLSPHISTSMGYSRMGHGTHNVKHAKKTGGNDGSGDKKIRFLCSNNIQCIAICEVITSPDLKKNNSIWVCPNEDNVCTRFFFVYEDGKVGNNSINTQDEKYLGSIRQACAYKM